MPQRPAAIVSLREYTAYGRHAERVGLGTPDRRREKAATMSDDDYDDAVERVGGVFIGRDLDLEEEEVSEDDLDFGQDRDPELWSRQLPLIEEDVAEGLRLADFPEEAIPRIIDAMGDDVAEPLQEYPGGVSATGSATQSDHGGFPERD